MGDYGTAHDISEDIMQADVRIKKLVRTCVIFGSEPKKYIAPNQKKKRKKHGYLPILKKVARIVFTDKKVMSGPLS